MSMKESRSLSEACTQIYSIILCSIVREAMLYIRPEKQNVMLVADWDLFLNLVKLMPRRRPQNTEMVTNSNLLLNMIISLRFLQSRMGYYCLPQKPQSKISMSMNLRRRRRKNRVHRQRETVKKDKVQYSKRPHVAHTPLDPPETRELKRTTQATPQIWRKVIG